MKKKKTKPKIIKNKENKYIYKLFIAANYGRKKNSIPKTPKYRDSKA